MSGLEIILVAANAAIGVPILVLTAEVVTACVGRSRTAMADSSHAPGSIAVLIPAHDEEGQIAQTVQSIKAQLRDRDRVLVVADNCADRTADVARSAGAEVLERSDSMERGKGYALAAGVRHLANDPPAVVVVVDADMQIASGSLRALSDAASISDVPVQSLDLLQPPPGASTKSLISAFAFALKNHARALGAERLGIPCLLRGTGMAFPWATIAGAKLATGNIVEDMQLGIDLAIAGHSPRFCATAKVTGHLPDSTSAARTQRTRWEHGHLRTILHNVPRLLREGIVQMRPSLVGLALDLAVPPLALLTVLWGVAAMLSLAGVFVGLTGTVPLWTAGVSGLLFMASVLAAWARFAREMLPLSRLVIVPFYIAWKIPLYLAFLVKPQRRWVRTARL